MKMNIRKMNIRRTWITIVLMLFVVSAYGSNVMRQGKESFVHNGGKWLITISAGEGSNNARYYLGLRNIFHHLLVNKSQNYRHVIDLDDKDFPGKFSFDMLQRKFSKLKTEIANFKKENPTINTRIVITITGHGDVKADGKYYYTSTSEDLSGENLLSLFLGPMADETIVFFQSCRSGQIASKDFTEFITNNPKYSNQKVSLHFPVPGDVNSKSLIWEYQVLGPSINDPKTDRNGDGFISIQELSEAIRIRSCQSFYYISPFQYNHANQEVLKSGVSYVSKNYNISPDLLLFPASGSKEDFNLFYFDMDINAARFCEAQDNLNQTLNNADLTEISKLIMSSEEITRYKAIKYLGENQFPFDENIVGTLLSIIKKEKNPTIAREAISTIGNFSKRNRQNSQVQLFLKYLQNIFPTAQEDMQEVSSQVFSRYIMPKQYDFYVEMLNHCNANTKTNIIITLGRIGNKAVIPLLVNIISYPSEINNALVRSKAVIALSLIGAREHTSTITNLLVHERDSNVRIEMISFLLKYYATEALPIIKDLAQNDPNQNVRIIAQYCLEVFAG